MARPKKTGLGYFPLDTDFLSDRKIQRLSQKYGTNGISVYIATLCEVYGTNGYYIHFHKDFCFDIGFTLHLEEELVTSIIRYCIQIRLFDNELLKRCNILSSAGIQRRFKEIAKRSKYHVDSEFSLSSDSAINETETTVNATETAINVSTTPESLTKTVLNGKRNKEKKTSYYENRYSENNREEARRAELLQMAALAATDSENA